MRLMLQPVRVATGAEKGGLLVFDDGRLVAVLVQLSEENEIAPGEWYLEAGFGGLDGPDHPTFKDLDGAQTWISQRLATQPAADARTSGGCSPSLSLSRYGLCLGSLRPSRIEVEGECWAS